MPRISVSSPNEQSPPDSLWRATARHADLDCPTLEGDVEADVVVVGGGFCGLSAALHLTENGLDTIVLEGRTIGHGASGRNGGQVNPGGKLSRAALERRFGDAGAQFHALFETAPDFLADLIARKRLDCGFSRPGSLRLAHSHKAMEAVRQDAEALNARGIDARLLERADAADMLGSDTYKGGLLDPRGGSLHPMDFSRALARAADAAGATIFEHSAALSVAQSSGGRWTVKTPRGTVRAANVIVATNAYTGSLIPRLQRSLLPVNSFQVATAPASPEVAARILPGGQAAYDSRRLVLYFRKTQDDRLVLGGRASFSSGRGEITKVPDYRLLETTLRDIFPAISEVRFERRWTGLVCITPDFLPHYHIPDPGLHVILGFNGRGVAAAVLSGAWIADEIAGKAHSDIAIPPTPIKPIPFHFLRAPALNLAMQVGRMMDRLQV